VTTDP